MALRKSLITDGYGIETVDLPAFDPEQRDASRIDPRTWFARADAPLELEVGSGKGTFLVQQASLQPDRNYLGIEIAQAFYRYAADRVRRRQLDNVRVLHADATEFVQYRCPGAVFDVVHLYFSDPWPKKRHHKRRVLQTSSLREFHRVLVPHGELRLVTDHETLWAWYEDLATQCGDAYERLPFAPPSSAGADELVGTNYERKFAREGRPLHAMTLRKRA